MPQGWRGKDTGLEREQRVMEEEGNGEEWVYEGQDEKGEDS